MCLCYMARENCEKAILNLKRMAVSFEGKTLGSLPLWNYFLMMEAFVILVRYKGRLSKNLHNSCVFFCFFFFDNLSNNIVKTWKYQYAKRTQDASKVWLFMIKNTLNVMILLIIIFVLCHDRVVCLWFLDSSGLMTGNFSPQDYGIISMTAM